MRLAAYALVTAAALLLLAPSLPTNDSLTLTPEDLEVGSHHSIAGADLEVTHFGVAFKCGTTDAVGVRCVGSPWWVQFHLTYPDSWTQDVDFAFGGSFCTPGEPNDLVVRHTWTLLRFHSVCGDDSIRVIRA